MIQQQQAEEAARLATRQREAALRDASRMQVGVTRSLSRPVASSITRPLTRSLARSLTRSLAHSLAHSVVRSIALSLARPFRTCACTHSRPPLRAPPPLRAQAGTEDLVAMGFDRNLSAAALLQVPLPLLLLLLPVFYIAAAIMRLVCYYTAPGRVTTMYLP